MSETNTLTEPVITVTEKALSKILELRSAEENPDDLGLRIEVTGVRGAEFSYDLAFEPLAECDADDVRHETGGLPVVVPADSVDKLLGATLDLPSNPDQGGLVLRNPNRPQVPQLGARYGDLVESLTDLARALTESESVRDTQQSILALALRSIPGCHAASITVHRVRHPRLDSRDHRGRRHHRPFVRRKPLLLTSTRSSTRGVGVPGILSYGSYVPYWRLPRTTIATALGSGGGKGTRAVASYDEDATSMGVEAGRLAMKAAPDGVTSAGVLFTSTALPYVDKTNATAIHAALGFDAVDPAYDVGSSREMDLPPTHVVHDLKLSFYYERKSGDGPLKVMLSDGRQFIQLAPHVARPSPTRSRPRSAPTNSSTAGGFPANGPRTCGRNASARPSSRRWPMGSWPTS